MSDGAAKPEGDNKMRTVCRCILMALMAHGLSGCSDEAGVSRNKTEGLMIRDHARTTVVSPSAGMVDQIAQACALAEFVGQSVSRTEELEGEFKVTTIDSTANLRFDSARALDLPSLASADGASPNGRELIVLLESLEKTSPGWLEASYVKSARSDWGKADPVRTLGLNVKIANRGASSEIRCERILKHREKAGAAK